VQKLIFIFISFFVLSGFSSGKIKKEKTKFLVFEDCPKSFEVALGPAHKKFDKLVYAYKAFSCFPIQAFDFLEKNHSEKSWVFSELAKLRILKTLTLQEKLVLNQKLFSHVTPKSEIEKYLLESISIKKELGIDYVKDQALLWLRFPSHNPNRLAKPDLSVIRDLKRRGQNVNALEILNSLHIKDKKDLKVLKEMISTQKNINRDAKYLDYSQKYVDAVAKRMRGKYRRSYYRRLYLNEELENIRRIWTYRSTDEAMSKLTALIKGFCRVERDCAEHYWIKGRIFEEQKKYAPAKIWYLKAVQKTDLNDSEYQNRVWNLAWLESKMSGSSQALLSSKKFLYKIKPNKVLSKFYYWMSVWATDPEESKGLKNAIRQHHPMSFYLWSDLTGGEGLSLKTQSIEKFKASLKTDVEKNLTRIMFLSEPTLAQSYIGYVDRNKLIKRNLNWKRLKALNGLYVDLLLDLEAGLISPEENLQFFFSRGFEDSVTESSQRFNIPKELIWSITRQESNFNPFARSWADAFGLMQILPKRAVSYLNDTRSKKQPEVAAVNPFKLFEPDFNIAIGAWLLRENLNIFDGKLPLAIAAYNASTGKVEEWERRFFKGSWIRFTEEITYRETRKYLKLVLRNLAIYQALEKAELIKAKEK
jgi:soluble lytic murein transglycosylase